MNRSDKVLPTTSFVWSRYPTTPELILMLALFVPLIAGIVPIVDAAQEHQCPPETFLASPLHIWPMVAGLILLVGTGYLTLRHALLHISALVRQRLDIEITCDASWHQRWGSIAAGSFAVGIALLWASVRMQMCLTDKAIIYRAWPTDAMATHRWNEVTGMEMWCHRRSRGGGIYYSQMLAMPDGTRLDVSGAYAEEAPSYPQLKKALNGAGSRPTVYPC